MTRPRSHSQDSREGIEARVPGPWSKHPSSRRGSSQEAPVCPPGAGPDTPTEFDREAGWGQAPVGPLSDHLEHADVEGPVEQVGAGQLVNPELGSCDRLPRRDLGQVKAELLPVGLLVARGAVELHCKTKRAVRSWLWAPGWQCPGSQGPGQPGRGISSLGMGLPTGSAPSAEGPQPCREVPSTAPDAGGPTRQLPFLAPKPPPSRSGPAPSVSGPTDEAERTGPSLEMDFRAKEKGRVAAGT